MAAWGAILSAVGGIVGAFGAYKSDMASVSKMNFDAKVALNNAELARQDSNIVAENAVQSRAALSKQEKFIRGEARTQYASGNVVVDQGSAADYDFAQAAEFAAQRETSRDEQAISQYRLNVEREGLLASAMLLRKGAKNARTGAKLGLISNALSAVGGGISGMGGGGGSRGSTSSPQVNTGRTNTQPVTPYSRPKQNPWMNSTYYQPGGRA